MYFLNLTFGLWLSRKLFLLAPRVHVTQHVRPNYYKRCAASDPLFSVTRQPCADAGAPRSLGIFAGCHGKEEGPAWWAGVWGAERDVGERCRTSARVSRRRARAGGAAVSSYPAAPRATVRVRSPPLPPRRAYW